MLGDREVLSVEGVEKGEQNPSEYLSVKLSDEVREPFERWLRGHLNLIKDSMRETLGRFEDEDNQLEGNMPGADYPYAGAFRVNYPLTKKKCREIANRMKQAYLDSDPVFSVTLSGEQKDELEVQLADRVERALDNAMDNHLEVMDDLSRAVFNSVHHGVGVLVPSWEYAEVVRKDLEEWRGWDGTTDNSIQEILKFEEKYPKWADDKDGLREIHSLLTSGKNVRRVITYRAPVRNSPCLTSVEPQDVRVYPWVRGYSGLYGTPCYGYVKHYRYNELLELAESGWIDSDALNRLCPSVEDVNPERENEQFEIFIGTVQHDLEGDLASYKVFFSVEKGILLRVRSFPWWCSDPDLIPLYSRQEEEGFFKRGFAWDLKDDHLILVVLLNMYLNGVDMANSMRLKAKKGSVAEAQLLSRRWSPHMPLTWKENPNEVDPMPFPTNHLSALIESIQMMRLVSDESTQTSTIQSGRESPTDPRAPASKTAMLLQQVEPNTKETIRSLEPGFRAVGRYILWLYYQGMRLGWIKGIPGEDGLTASDIREVIDRLNPRALLFETEKTQRVERNMAVLNMVAQYAPGAVPRVLKIAVGSMSSDWARAVNSLPLETPPAPPGGVPGAPTPGGGDPLQALAALAQSAGNPGLQKAPGVKPTRGGGMVLSKNGKGPRG